MDYRESGVDRALADSFVEGLKSKVKKTHRKEVLGDLGDFGCFFRAPAGMREPIFVASTDGVGTKLELAEKVGGRAHRSVGQDVVAMCVNDLIACKAEPLIFLDYLATGKLEPKALEALMDGIVDACKESLCTLAGGETAEMPGYYPQGRYDVAGFSVGVLERSERLDPQAVVPGDCILGLGSSGFHSNGYSLVRRVLQMQGWKLDQDFEGEALGELLLRPTKLYVKPVLETLKRAPIKAAAHITGGGLVENLPRGVVESRVRLILNRSKIKTPSFMKRFVEAAELEEREAFSTWNMGLGFAAIVSKEARDLVLGQNEEGWVEIGRVEARSAGSESVEFVE